MGAGADGGLSGLVRVTSSRAKSFAGGLIDLILPPVTLDGSTRALTGGLSAETWGRIAFIDGPLCDGCGQPVLLLTN